MALRPVLRQVLRRRVLRPVLRQVLRRRVLPLAKQEGHTSERETKLTTLTTVHLHNLRQNPRTTERDRECLLAAL